MAKTKPRARSRPRPRGPRKTPKKVAAPNGKDYVTVTGVIAAPSCLVYTKHGKDWVEIDSDVVSAGTRIRLDPKAAHTAKWLDMGAIK